MAEERDIEKQLRAAAEQRRREAGAPFELHPATRRLLQDEVRRAHRRPVGPAERTSLFAGWWFRIAAGACVVVLALAVFFPVLSSSKSKRPQHTETLGLRKKTLTGPAENRPASPPPASAPAPAATPPPGRDDTDKERLVATREIALNAAPTKSPAVNVTNAIVARAATGVPVFAFDTHSATQMVFFRNADAPADISSTRSGQVTDELAKSDLKQSLSDQTKLAGGKSPLAVFQMAQTGNQIRITDSDGSIYSGDLTSATVETSGARPAGTASTPPAMTTGKSGEQLEQPARRNETFSLGTPAGQQNQNFRFNATGTNLSLNQRVTINGEFIAATNPADFGGAAQNRVGGSGGGGGGGEPRSQSAVNPPPPLATGHIVGKAVLDNGREIPINAAPAAP